MRICLFTVVPFQVDLILSGFCEDSGISLEEALADVENMSKTDDIKAVFEVRLLATASFH